MPCNRVRLAVWLCGDAVIISETQYLTSKALHQEYAEWPDSNRNHRDLRFGQHIMNKYGIRDPDVFHLEDQDKAYMLLAESLKGYQT